MSSVPFTSSHTTIPKFFALQDSSGTLLDSTIADINGPDDTLLSSQLASGSNGSTGGSEGQVGNAAGVMSFKNLWLCPAMHNILIAIGTSLNHLYSHDHVLYGEL